MLQITQVEWYHVLHYTDWTINRRDYTVQEAIKELISFENVEDHVRTIALQVEFWVLTHF